VKDWSKTNTCKVVAWETDYNIYIADDYKRCVCDNWGTADNAGECAMEAGETMTETETETETVVETETETVVETETETVVETETETVVETESETES